MVHVLHVLVVDLFRFWVFPQKAHLLAPVGMRELQDMHSTSFSNSIMGSDLCLTRDLRNHISARIPMIMGRRNASAMFEVGTAISNQEAIFSSIVYHRVESS